MSTVKTRRAAAETLVAIILILSSCGPPQSCGVGGIADKATFSQHFAQMVLVSGATGEPGQPGDDGPKFTPTDEVVIQAESLAEVSLWACVEERNAGGRTPFDDARVLPAGVGRFSVGSFPPGNYVVRVTVDDTLVINLPFSVE